jgi:hypothetical protein
MSSIGSPIDTSLLQTAQAQQQAGKARDREKAESAGGRRFEDLVELRVAGMETAEAVRKLPHNESEQAETEHESKSGPPRRRADDDDRRSHIDVHA